MSQEPDAALDYLQGQLGLSALETRLLTAVANHPLPGATANGLRRRFDPGRPRAALEVTLFDAEEAEQSVARLIKRGFLQVLTTETLAEIQEFVAGDGSTLFDVWPEPGWVDFTWKGAVLWRGLDAVLYGRKSYWLVTNLLGPIEGLECVDVVGTDLCDVERVLQEQREEAEALHASVEIEGPDRIGRWREPWWRLFSEGYRARVFFATDDVSSTVRVGRWA